MPSRDHLLKRGPCHALAAVPVQEPLVRQHPPGSRHAAVPGARTRASAIGRSSSFATSVGPGSASSLPPNPNPNVTHARSPSRLSSSRCESSRHWPRLTAAPMTARASSGASPWRPGREDAAHATTGASHFPGPHQPQARRTENSQTRSPDIERGKRETPSHRQARELTRPFSVRPSGSAPHGSSALGVFAQVCVTNAERSLM